MWASKNQECLFGGSYCKDDVVFGGNLCAPIFGTSHIESLGASLPWRGDRSFEGSRQCYCALPQRVSPGRLAHVEPRGSTYSLSPYLRTLVPKTIYQVWFLEPECLNREYVVVGPFGKLKELL